MELTETSSEPRTAVPNNLNRAILQQGRKRKWLAEQLGVSRMTLHRYCYEQHAVPLGRQARLAELLGVTPEELFPAEAPDAA